MNMATPKYSHIFQTIFILSAVCLASIPAQGQYGGGTGEPNNPFLIYTAEQLNKIGLHSEDWDKHFKLMANIDLGGLHTYFHIIGTGNGFTGVFDGNGHIISTFSYNSTSRDTAGLFKYITGQLRDVRLVAFDVQAENAVGVGSLVGTVGGGGIVAACSVERGSVSAAWDVGGLAGKNYGTITNCSSSVNVSGTNWRVGGLVGSGGTITNCSSTGSVSGENYVGGLVGRAEAITDCSSSAVVDGNESVGGLVG
jgi:hypothetical protein